MCEIERCSVSEPVFKHNHCAPAFTTKMGSCSSCSEDKSPMVPNPDHKRYWNNWKNDMSLFSVTNQERPYEQLLHNCKNVVLGRSLISSQVILRKLASNSFRHSIVSFSNCLHVEFPILNKITGNDCTSKSLSTVCFLTVPGSGCSKLG